MASLTQAAKLLLVLPSRWVSEFRFGTFLILQETATSRALVQSARDRYLYFCARSLRRTATSDYVSSCRALRTHTIAKLTTIRRCHRRGLGDLNTSPHKRRSRHRERASVSLVLRWSTVQIQRFWLCQNDDSLFNDLLRQDTRVVSQRFAPILCRDFTPQICGPSDPGACAPGCYGAGLRL